MFKRFLASLFSLAFMACLVTSCAGNSTSEPLSNVPIYLGVEEVSASQIVSLLPENTSQPVLLEFTSKFCSDCKRLKPVLSSLKNKFPKVAYTSLEIKAHRKSHAAIFNSFQPSITPTLIFIQPGGKVSNILYGFQEEGTLKRAFEQLKTI